MHEYYNARGPCFDGNCEIELANGEFKKVGQLRKGEVVKAARNKVDKVACIVKTYCKEGVEFVEFGGGLKITPWHPICVNEEWAFPVEVNSKLSVESRPTTIYSIVLEKEHSIWINGMECASLGHNEKKAVLAHPYFGSRKVIEDLRLMNGWHLGEV